MSVARPSGRSLSSHGVVGGRTTPTSQVFSLTLEDNPSFEYDVTHMAGPLQVRMELGVAVQARTTTAGGLRRTASVVTMTLALSAFLKWVDAWNRSNRQDDSLLILSLADLTPFHLRRYRDSLETNYAARSAFQYYADFALLVRHAPAAREETRREAAKRKGSEPKSAASVQRYSKRELTQIQNAARRTVEAAHERITAAYGLATSQGQTGRVSSLRATALHDIIVHGRPQSREGMRILGATSAAISGSGGGVAAVRQHLFLSPDEAFAAAVLLVCQSGLNLSPVVTAPVPWEHEPGVWQLDVDKPRRGPTSRFWAEIFDDSESFGQITRAKSIRLIKEATDPARHYFAAKGEPANRLLIYWAKSAAAPRFGIPRFESQKRAAWVPQGTNILFSRLRRSAPGRGVAKEPTHHSPETYLKYVRSDPESLDEMREAAALGVQKLVDQARASLAIRIAADAETDARNDAVLVNCSDPLHNPVTTTACSTGFYSFFDCLKCDNAATVPRLLSRQMAALQVLETLRDGMGEAWERRFAAHHQTLLSLTQRHTPMERGLAASDASKHVPTIIAALRNEVPE